MPQDDSSDPKTLTRKERARSQRRAAYQWAKERRANDPRTAAMKEKLKAHRRELYQRAKERQKARASEHKRATREQSQKANEQSRAAADAELMTLVTITAKGSSALN